MNKFLRWGVPVIAMVLLGSLIYNHYVLNSQKLDAAIKNELPPGTTKALVIQFIQARKPQYWDDLGTHVKARLTGRAENLIYRQDISCDEKAQGHGSLPHCFICSYTNDSPRQIGTKRMHRSVEWVLFVLVHHRSLAWVLGCHDICCCLADCCRRAGPQKALTKRRDEFGCRKLWFSLRLRV